MKFYEKKMRTFFFFVYYFDGIKYIWNFLEFEDNSKMILDHK